jgi:uncharacterized protein (TIGR02646 family)
MKRVLKSQEPAELDRYRQAAPASTWQQMKDDPHHGGKSSYTTCRSQVIADQGGLCCYCELDIRDNNPLRSRVEHFHPKSDITPRHNWALDWANLLGACSGGSNRYASKDDDSSKADHFLEPLEFNLSCDAHKDRMIQAGKLPDQCEGWILNPLQLAASPPLFRMDKSSGKLQADPQHCATFPVDGNQHASTLTLVEHTIEMLNLNCDRLTQARLRVIRNIERAKKLERQKGLTAAQGLANLVSRYWLTQWPQFFTTQRLCLGAAAEIHLQAISFNG